MLIGHVGVALLEHRLLKADLAPAMAGALFPDVLDKTLCQVLELTPSGRMWGHTTLSVGITTILVSVVAGRHAARSWFLGYLGHLLADLEGPIPWWYPFRAYEFKQSPGFADILKRFAENRSEMILEIGLLGLGILALGTKRKA